MTLSTWSEPLQASQVDFERVVERRPSLVPSTTLGPRQHAHTTLAGRMTCLEAVTRLLLML